MKKQLFTLLLFGFLSTISFAAIEDTLKNESAETPVSFYDTSSIFTENWQVNITFSYANQSFDNNTVIPLVDSIHGYAFPVEKVTTSGFGHRHGRPHKGIDIPLKTGENVVAAFDGKVRYAHYNNGGFGNLVIIRHANGLETYYAHLSKLKVKPNQVVRAGEVIGLGGSTGRSYSPHLHFEVRYHDVAFNPEQIFDTELYCLREENATVADLMQKHIHKPRPLTEDFLAEGTAYSIESGDTLSRIAARSGTTVEKLCALNGLNRSSVLQIGQKIRVN
ncbi:MAG: peptidoglycan DD-metalloendopeptidase family protein [Crocinitomicaceae bacterium]|nr:peptidoglycan DD-metalloendopeptidase family protein [Crocinitomicaceae bacterium]